MKIFVEDISEDYGTHGVSMYSLVQGMDVYHAEVRASGIDIVSRNMDTGESTPLESEYKYKELVEALTPELYKEK